MIHDKEAIKLIKAKVYLFSDSVLRVGGIREFPEPNTEWERRLAWFKSSHQYSELDGIDGELVEFEWMIFPRTHHTSDFTTRSKNSWILRTAEKKLFKDESPSCRCVTTLIVEMKTKQKSVWQIHYLWV